MMSMVLVILLSQVEHFPFSEGIVLSTGDALLASGPNSGLGNASTGSGQWPGDDDLSALIGEETNNASTIEFDFVPISNNLSFRFIMASEEYDQGSFECFYSDVFAFLLTDSEWKYNQSCGYP